MFHNQGNSVRGSPARGPGGPPPGRSRAPSSVGSVSSQGPSAAQLALQYDQDKERIVRSCFSKKDDKGLGEFYLIL